MGRDLLGGATTGRGSVDAISFQLGLRGGLSHGRTTSLFKRGSEGSGSGDK